MRFKFNHVIILMIAVALVVLAGCGGGSPDEGQVRDAYNSAPAKCYLKSEITVDERFGVAIPETPTAQCGNPDAVGDIWLYALRYNESDPQKEKSLDNLKETIGADCEKLPQSLWGNKWELFDDGILDPDPASDQQVYIMICGWTEGDTDISRTAAGTKYQSRVASIIKSDRLGFKVLGPACESNNNGWFYSGNLDGGLTGLCVQYYEATGSVESCNSNRSVCIDIDYEIGIPEHICNGNGLCDSPWEHDSDCGDCRTDCNAMAADLPEGAVSFSELAVSHKEAVLACQGDLNSPGYLSTRFVCKMCPKTYSKEPYLPGRDWLPNSWAWPWSAPSGSYSNDNDNIGWGCVNVAEGSPMNCGVCGFKDVTKETTIKNSLEFLAGGFCAATFYSNNVFCADLPNPGRMEYHCVPPDQARGDPSTSPWFGKYQANPSYFYTPVPVGSGWKSTVTAITCAEP